MAPHLPLVPHLPGLTPDTSPQIVRGAQTPKGPPVINAVVLLNTSIEDIPDVAETLADIDGVSEVYSVAGRYDLVAMVRVKEPEDVARVVTEQIAKVSGIQSTETLIAFRAYSRHDLEAAFSLGYQARE